MADHMPMIDEDWEEWDPSKGSFVHHMIAGSAAGVMEHVAMFPLDTYKTFLQTSAKSSNPPSFAALLKQHGFARLWRGAPAMLTACIPSHTAYFTVYEVAKDAFGVNSPGHHVVGAAAAGACATVMHDAIITPMDLVKQRLQLGYYSGVWDCLTSVTRSEGLSALWRAFPTTLVMNIPYASVVVATNESMKEVLNPGGQHDMGVYLTSGAVSGAVAACATTPLDVIKTRLQTQQCSAQALEACAVHAESVPVPPPAPPSSTTSSTLRSAARRLAATSSSLLGSGGQGAPGLQVAQYYTKPDKGVPGGGAADCACAPPSTRPPQGPRYAGVLDVARKLHAEEGLAGFFRGLGARVALHTPAMAISWGTYEAVKYALQHA